MKAELQRGEVLNGGRYIIDGLLGAGGQGEVYKAVDHNRDCVVAVKRREAQSERLRDRGKHREDFEREAKLLSNLIHPSLPRVIHHFFEDDEQYFVMDFIEGDDLEEALNKQEYRPFTVDFVLDVADKLLEALNYLHSRPEPIIHRDIKPQNIKVTKEGYVYLLDFGLAKGAAGQMSTIQTDAHSAFGRTLAYAPLEQLNGSRTSAQSDLYSLGATLYRVLTGRLLTSASERNDSMERGQPDPLLPIHHFNPNVTFSLSGVISQAMAISRKDRIKSAGEMREALRAVRLEIEAERARQEEEQRRRAEEAARREEEEKRRQQAETERLELEALLREQEETRRRSEEQTLRLRQQEGARLRQAAETIPVQGSNEKQFVERGATLEQMPQWPALNIEPREAVPPTQIPMGRYVVWFGAIYMGLLAILNFFAITFQWDLKGLRDALPLFIIMAAAITASRRFVKNQKRYFTKSERFTMVCYAFVIVLLSQTIFSIVIIRLYEIPMDATSLLIGLSVSMFFSLLGIIGGFGSWGKRFSGIKG